MILVDTREDTSGPKADRGTKKMLQAILGLAAPAQEARLPYGDAAFEGNGPRGSVMIGIERKRVHDLLHCIDDSRYSGFQKVGMHQMYQKQYLLLEGYWGPGRPPNLQGILVQAEGHGKGWYACNYRSKDVLYSKLRRYLFSIGNSGVEIIYTMDGFHSACDIVELFRYYQKPWAEHTAMMETHKVALPDIRYEIPLVRKWAADIDGVGVKFSLEAEKLFKTGYHLAMGTELDWMKIKRLGVSTAQKIVREVHGVRR